MAASLRGVEMLLLEMSFPIQQQQQPKQQQAAGK